MEKSSRSAVLKSGCSRWLPSSISVWSKLCTIDDVEELHYDPPGSPWRPLHLFAGESFWQVASSMGGRSWKMSELSPFLWNVIAWKKRNDRHFPSMAAQWPRMHWTHSHQPLLENEHEHHFGHFSGLSHWSIMSCGRWDVMVIKHDKNITSNFLAPNSD